MRVWHYLVSGAVARWPLADRCLLISVAVFVLYFYLAGLVAYLAATIDELPFFNPHVIALLDDVSYWTVGGWILLVVASLTVGRKYPDSAFFAHAPVQLYAVNSAFYSYVLGPMTSPFFAFAYLGGILVSIPLFGGAPTFRGVLTLTTIVVSALVAEQLGWIPSSPALADYPIDPDSGVLSVTWLIGFGSFELIGLVLSFVLAVLLIDQLQHREQALVEHGDHLGTVTAELESLGAALTARNEQLLEQADELALARDSAQASDLAKSRFLSRVSHETRTPLSGILGFTELLEGQHFGQLNERQASYVRRIHESGEHMLELINDLLDVTRLHTDEVELSLEDVPPDEVAREVVHNMEQGSIEKGVEIVNEIGPDAPVLHVDRRRLRQSLYNLLSNAVKFTAPGGRVGLCWSLETEGWLCIEVWDEGIGIAAEDLERIFEEFQQVDRKRDEALGGSGIGLALTRRLAEVHGGEVRVESKLGSGSRFFHVMPRAVADSDAAAPKLRKDDDPKKTGRSMFDANPRVLVVDDNPANVAVIRGLLEVRGIDPIVIRGGGAALAVVERERPELVLMDIFMPGCDGFEALAQIRAQESLSAIPVVAMTANATESEQARYIEAGFDAFLAKPIDSARLDDQLVRFLSPAEPR